VYHFKDGLVEFVRYLNRTQTPITTDVFRVVGEEADVVVETAMQYNDGYTENVLTFANNILQRGWRNASQRIPYGADEDDE